MQVIFEVRHRDELFTSFSQLLHICLRRFKGLLWYYCEINNRQFKLFIKIFVKLIRKYFPGLIRVNFIEDCHSIFVLIFRSRKFGKNIFPVNLDLLFWLDFYLIGLWLFLLLFWLLFNFLLWLFALHLICLILCFFLSGILWNLLIFLFICFFLLFFLFFLFLVFFFLVFFFLVFFFLLFFLFFFLLLFINFFLLRFLIRFFFC